MQCPACRSEILDDSRFCSKCGAPIHSSDKDQMFYTKTMRAPMKELFVGTMLAGKYRIIEEVGRGGMGIVYKAEDSRLKRAVALKFLPPELTRDTEARERFILEAQAAAALSHPNICTIHEVGEAEGKSYIAMEFIEGRSLREKIKISPFGLEDALDLVIQLAAGLEEAHKKGIIHRDIKSANLMVTDKGLAKIMDFGLAKLRGENPLTKEGATLGTAAYMSPEQARGEKVDHRTDIWSLGVVFYEILTGELPFRGEREASLLYAIVHEEPKRPKTLEPGIPSEIIKIIGRALEKKPESRYPSAGEMLKDLKEYQHSLHASEAGVLSLRSLWRRLRRPRVAVPALAAILALGFLGVWYFSRQAKIRWAQHELLPKVEQLIYAGRENFIDAYQLAVQAEKYLPRAPKLAEFLAEISLHISIRTEPSGAKIFYKEYKAPESGWKYLGVSPIENTRMPIGFFRWLVDKDGYEKVLAASPTFEMVFVGKRRFIPNSLWKYLDKKGSIPAGMMRIKGERLAGLGELGDFFMDQYEVTNKKFKEFIDKGGYLRKEYWKNEFLKDGKVLEWEKAVAECVDQTGRPGPAAWQGGDFPAGQGDFPVSGISWYEAAAFAEFAGKSLPTRYHWDIASRGVSAALFTRGLSTLLVSMSNFAGEGPAPVGRYPGLTVSGLYDLAGNVREWCWNESPDGRVLRGGAWNDAPYMFNNISQAVPFDRSPKNGFRCVVYIHPDKIPKPAFDLVKVSEVPDFYKEKPVSDSVYQVYKEQFSYDKSDLNARVEWKNENSPDWIQEKITFRAAYENERVIAYLFLPKKRQRPYQTVVYFPGSGSISQKSSEDIDKYWEFDDRLSVIVKNGRAVLYPVYKGTFERGDEALTSAAPNSHLYTEWLIKIVKDCRRCIDYLETRPDIDSNKLAYFGFSWGGGLGPMALAVEGRFKAGILAVGGMDGGRRPEASQISYISRVKIPTLMLNGKFDMRFPYETKVKPMFDLLGTSPEHKELKLYETDHFIPRIEFIKETLRWLDKYLGPVK